ncbi:hypothetical protein ACWD26_16645 [Streptomyces sp. NPDC002787]
MIQIRGTLSLCLVEVRPKPLDFQLELVVLGNEAGDVGVCRRELVCPLLLRDTVGLKLVETRLEVGDGLCPVQQRIAQDLALHQQHHPHRQERAVVPCV